MNQILKSLAYNCCGKANSCRWVLFKTFSTDISTNSESIPPPALGDQKYFEPKIVSLVDSISNLTLREVADLNELLKIKLDIKDIAVSAPVVASSANASSDQSEDEKAPEKDEFSIKLVSFAAADKIKLIKALKVVKPSLNLVQAKKVVESLPQLVLEDIPKEEIEDMKKTLEEAGGKIEII